MKLKKLAPILLCVFLLTGCVPRSLTMPAPTKSATTAAPTAAYTVDIEGIDEDRPFTNPQNRIDKYFAAESENAVDTVTERLFASNYYSAWYDEMYHAAEAANAEDARTAWEEAADKAADEELKNWDGGTGGPGASAMAAALVYRRAALAFIDDLPNYEYLFTTEYMPLLQSLAGSEVLHYDAFDRVPDATTANLTMYGMVLEQNIYPGMKTVRPDSGGTYYFYDDSEDENGDDASPDDVYEGFFADGDYSYPDKPLSVVERTQNGIAVKSLHVSYSAQLHIVEVEHKSDGLAVTIDLTAIDNGNGDYTSLGTATVVFERDDDAPCGFTIVSYTPEYEAFEDRI